MHEVALTSHDYSVLFRRGRRAEARQWYAHQRIDLDLEFMESVDQALTEVVRNPHLYPIVYRNLRRAVVRRFPFAVFFDVNEDEIQVIAVFHSRRDPEAWQSRVP